MIIQSVAVHVMRKGINYTCYQVLDFRLWVRRLQTLTRCKNAVLQYKDVCTVLGGID